MSLITLSVRIKDEKAEGTVDEVLEVVEEQLKLLSWSCRDLMLAISSYESRDKTNLSDSK